MPSQFPRSPKFLKGALAVYESDTAGTTPKMIVFQYNSDQIVRRLANRTPPAEAGNVGAVREDARRVLGPPVETITLTVVLNAADQLADPEQHRDTLEHGLHPTLATLEMLLYPSTTRVQEIQQLAEQGEVQISPAELPLTLLIWGRSRVVPVQVTNFSVTEDAFDPVLNPIQAKVELSLQVLTYMELQQSSLGYDAYLAYQEQKETLAERHKNTTVAQRVRGLLPL